MVLISQGQRGVLFDGVLRRGSNGARGDREVIGQADAQRVTDLRTVAGEFVAVLPVNGGDERVGVAEQTYRFSGDFLAGKQGIRHDGLLSD